MIGYCQYLFFAIAIVACLLGCSPAPPANSSLDENAAHYDVSTLEVSSQDKDSEEVSVSDENSPDSDDWHVIRHNEDGSTEIEIVVVNFSPETRSREMTLESGETRVETYEIMVPIQETEHVVVPSGVSISDYLEEHYTVIEEPFEEPQSVDLVTEAPMEDYSP